MSEIIEMIEQEIMEAAEAECKAFLGKAEKVYDPENDRFVAGEPGEVPEELVKEKAKLIRKQFVERLFSHINSPRR